MLIGQDDLGGNFGRVLVVRRNPTAATLTGCRPGSAGDPGRLHEQRAAVALTAGLDEQGGSLLGQELRFLALELVPWAAAPTPARLGRVGQRQQLGIGLAFGERFPASGDLADRARQDDRPFELPFISGEIGLGLGVEVDDPGFERAVGAGRPRLGETDQRDALGLDHLRREPLERPAAPERPPRLEVGVGQAPCRQLVTRPLVGPLHVG